MTLTEAQKKHKEKMQKQKAKVDASIAAASEERGIAVLLTGNGKGKTSSAMGMVVRALGYRQNVGIVQFIKGAQSSGEALFLKDHPSVDLKQMGTGFTWNTQDKDADIAAAERTWAYASAMLADQHYDLVVPRISQF